MNRVELSIVMPCLNESRTLAICIGKAKRFLEEAGVAGEVIIADNGSTDGSQQIAAENGATVVPVPGRGYGRALAGGISAARGRYVIMGDSDDSYDFLESGRLLSALRDGSEMVIGNRFRGGIAPGAMPFLHRYLGNPALSLLARILFGVPVGDIYCGLRGFSKECVQAMNLRSPGMEFAVEMILKGTLSRLRMTEVPVKLQPDGRDRRPHLRTWRDGFRTVAFMLVYSPRWLFLYPGALLAAVGAAAGARLFLGPLRVAEGVTLDVHSYLLCCLAVIIGVQLCGFGLLTRTYGVARGLLPRLEARSRLHRLAEPRNFAVAGILSLLAGVILFARSFLYWKAAGFGALQHEEMVRHIGLTMTALVIGTFLSLLSVVLSVLRAQDDGLPS